VLSSSGAGAFTSTGRALGLNQAIFEIGLEPPDAPSGCSGDPEDGGATITWSASDSCFIGQSIAAAVLAAAGISDVELVAPTPSGNELTAAGSGTATAVGASIATGVLAANGTSFAVGTSQGNITLATAGSSNLGCIGQSTAAAVAGLSGSGTFTGHSVAGVSAVLSVVGLGDLAFTPTTFPISIIRIVGGYPHYDLSISVTPLGYLKITGELEE
jgi:hypothetical protein